MDREMGKERALDVLTGVGSSMIPGAGGALASLLSGERIRQFQKDINDRMEELAARVQEANADAMLSSPAGRTAFVKVAEAVSKEAHEDKRRLLANALVNGFGGGAADGPDVQSAEHNYFLALVLAYEPELVNTLARTFIVQQRGDMLYPSRSWVRVSDDISHYVSRLDADGLVEVEVAALEATSGSALSAPPTERKYVCSPLGWRFLEMVDPGFLEPRPA